MIWQSDEAILLEYFGTMQFHSFTQSSIHIYVHSITWYEETKGKVTSLEAHAQTFISKLTHVKINSLQTLKNEVRSQMSIVRESGRCHLSVLCLLRHVYCPSCSVASLAVTNSREAKLAGDTWSSTATNSFSTSQHLSLNWPNDNYSILPWSMVRTIWKKWLSTMLWEVRSSDCVISGSSLHKCQSLGQYPIW